MSRSVQAVLGIVNGGIGIHWTMLGIEHDKFPPFLISLYTAAGFPSPRNVRHERNHQAHPGVLTDWNRLRIARDECQLQGVNPKEALPRIKEFLESEAILQEYSILFIVQLPDLNHDHQS